MRLPPRAACAALARVAAAASAAAVPGTTRVDCFHTGGHGVCRYEARDGSRALLRARGRVTDRYAGLRRPD